MSAAASAAPGLDLVLLIDRSKSMAHRSGHQDVLLRMTVDLLARDAAANRVEHRIAVIGFGSTAVMELPLTRADLALHGRIAGLRYRDGGETDVLAAFSAAATLFSTLPHDDARRRAIVVLTDGVAYVHGVDADRYNATLHTFVNEHVIRQGITIDVLLIGAAHREAWSEIARVAVTGTAADRVLPTAHNVIARLAGTRTAETAVSKTNPSVDVLVVPPYLDVIVFDVFRAAAKASVDIYPPNSRKPIQAGHDGIAAMAAGDVLFTLVVPRPAAGEWTIRKSRPDARVRVLSQQFFPRGELLRPAETDLISRCTHVPLAYRVLDADGTPLQELSSYGLSLDLTLAKPDGATAAVSMGHAPALGASAFRSLIDPWCDVAGRYWTDIRVTTRDATGHSLEVFRDRWSGFSVAPSDCKKPRP